MQCRVLAAIVCLVVLGLFSGQVIADLPTTWEVTYGIHETPTDPESDIIYTITLSLERDDVNGDSIGWDITSVEVREIGNPDTVWTDDNPTVSTADGLWWIDHEDADDPQMDEFILPPQITGTASAEDPSHTDLDYDIEGVTYTSDPLYDITAGLDYTFTLAGEEEPIKTGPGEPVETDPPIGA